MQRIPFNLPYFAEDQEKYVLSALQSSHLSGDGPFTERCVAILERIFKDSKVLLTPSCTAALELVALLLEIKDGDEIIMPSYTFVSTANAFALRGAKLVFCDIEKSNKIISLKSIEEKLTPRTRAIVVVQYAGLCGSDIIQIRDICDSHNICLVEDAAQSIGALFCGKPVGSFGHLSTISFHETKNLHCGEGGALVINDQSFLERAEVLREKGTNRSRFYRGEIDKYTWQDIGSSYLLSDLQSAMLYAQLLDLDCITNSRINQYNLYCKLLKPLSTHGLATCSCIRDMHLVGNGHIYWLQFKSLEERTDFISYMNSKGISAIFHYVALHSSPFGKKYGLIDLPETSASSDCLVRLPNFVGVDVQRVAQAALEYFKLL